MPGVLVLEQALNGLQFGLMLFLLAAGPDARVRHHGHDQPGARLALHGRRLPRAPGWSALTGSFLLGVARRGRAHGAVRHGARGRRCCARSTRATTFAGARHLRADPDPQRGVQHDLRQRPAAARAPAALAGPVELLPGPALPGLPPADHRRRPGARAAALPPGARRRGWACWSAPAPRTARWRPPWASTSGASSRVVFGIGAALCAVAGALLGPLLAVQVGMGENILILAFVVIVIGGIGSIRGALVGALLVGVVDTLGRALPAARSSREFLPPQWASAAGPALASMLIYVLHGGGAGDPAAGPVPGARLMASTLPSPRLAARARGRCCRSRSRCRRRCSALGADFYLSLASRIVIYAIAATSLNLVLGYGGMVSLRPRRLLRRSAPTSTGILVSEGVRSGLAAPGRRRSRSRRSPRWSSARSRCARAACTSS